MCFPQQQGNKTCACSGNDTSGTETFCDCSDMKKSFEARLTAIEKKLEDSN